MKKFNLIALVLLAATALPVYADGVATITKIAESSTAVKHIAIIHEGKESQVTTDGEINLADVVETTTNTATLKMKKGEIWTLDEKTRFAILEYPAPKAVYELQEGSASYQAGKKAPEAVIKVDSQEYLISRDAVISISYDKTSTTLIVEAGSVVVGNETIKQGNIAKIDATGKIEISKTQAAPEKHKTRGIRGHHEDEDNKKMP